MLDLFFSEVRNCHLDDKICGFYGRSLYKQNKRETQKENTMLEFQNKTNEKLLADYFWLAERKRLIGIGRVMKDSTYSEKVIEVDKITTKIEKLADWLHTKV